MGVIFNFGTCKYEAEVLLNFLHRSISWEVFWNLYTF